MADIKILDCTLRDGGYVNKNTFGYKNIGRIIDALNESGIDIIECGYFKDTSDVYSNNITEFTSFNDFKSKHQTHLLDYFTNPKENIIIKPHPADSIENYNKIFKDIEELNRKMPSELFPLCIDKKFEKGITCWSTSIFGLNKLLKNIVNFDTRIDTTFRDFDKYYAIIKYLEEIKEDKIVNLKLININEIQLLNLLKYHFKDYKKYYNITDIEDDNTIYIVDKLDDNYKNKKVLSINSSFTSNGILYIDKIIEYKDNEIKILEEHNNEKRRLLNIKDEKIYFLYKDIDSKNETINNIYNSSSWKLTKPIRLIIDKLRHIK